MLPLQCPVNVTLSHATALSVRDGTTALAVVGDALGSLLRGISNQTPEWMSGPAVHEADPDAAVQTTSGAGNTLLGVVAVIGIVAVGALRVWQYRQPGQRLAQIRAERAAEPPAPARVRQRRNAVDGLAALPQPAPDGLMHAQREQVRRDQAFIDGSTLGYLDASAGRTGQLIEITESEGMTDEVRYFRLGYRVGVESASSYRDAAEDSA